MAWSVARRIAAGALLALALEAAADFALWSYWRQQLQQRADLAALAGAEALRLGRPGAALALAAVPPGLDLAEPPQIEHPPRTGFHAGRANAVRVRLTAVRRPIFASRLFGPAAMTAQGTAALLPTRRPGTTMAARVE